MREGRRETGGRECHLLGNQDQMGGYSEEPQSYTVEGSVCVQEQEGS